MKSEKTNHLKVFKELRIGERKRKRCNGKKKKQMRGSLEKVGIMVLRRPNKISLDMNRL